MAGISEVFSLSGHRSLYGTTKLAAELLVQEYRAIYGLRAIINRCGVISGPWQMGKVDHGFVVLWLARHLFGGPLSYMGFGGHGLQVRDVLHVDDLYDLIVRQLNGLDEYSGTLFNVGGGMASSVSLRELTSMTQELSGRTIELGHVSETRDADIPFYVSDYQAVTRTTGPSNASRAAARPDSSSPTGTSAIPSHRRATASHRSVSGSRRSRHRGGRTR